jgi:hypothetical protein
MNSGGAKDKFADRVTLILALLVCAGAFAAGINWGLPSRVADRFLFGQRTPWTGKEIMQLIGDRGGAQGADVDRDPLSRSATPMVLNETDAQRAAIVLRYRLYSDQPDEMITFMSLAGMRPRQLQLDPKLYQYGGLWIYPVGGLVGATLGPKSDAAHFLDHPEDFAKFYIVARCYSAVWGLIGAIAVWKLVRTFTASRAACSFAVISFGFLPVVVNMAHEAKPHLPALSLQLWAVVAAIAFVRTGLKRHWIAAGAACGASVAMILSAWPIFVALPAMVFLRAMRVREPEESPRVSRFVVLLAAMVIGIDVYAATNPYVVKHLLTWNAPNNLLRSNIENSRAMYRASLSMQSVKDATTLLGYAATPAVIAAGVLGTIGIGLRRRDVSAHDRTGRAREGSGPPSDQPPERDRILREDIQDDNLCPPRGALGLLLAPSIIILGQFTILAAGKPGEFARFLIFPAVSLLIVAAGWIGRLLVRERELVRVSGGAILAAILVNVLLVGTSYIWHFINDASTPSTRHKVAARLADLKPQVLKISAEPAPYSVPPVDLFDTKLVLTADLNELATGQMSLRTIDLVRGEELFAAQPLLAKARPRDLHHDFWMRPRLLWTPISWANKTFQVRAGQADSALPDR